MDETFYYELRYPGMESVSEWGFNSYDDAYDAMTEAMTDMIDKIAEEHPEIPDEEIEKAIDWEVRPE